MLQGYHILTITHKHTPLNQIAHFVLESEQLMEQLQVLQATMQVEEMMYLATCNRVLVCMYSKEKVNKYFVHRFFKHINPDLDTQLIDSYVQHHAGLDALNHLLEVSASIDSLVVGEREILRQVRDAYEQCRNWGMCGHKLQMAFDRAVIAAKEVYTNTAIGDRSVSVVALAMEQFSNDHLPKNARILMIGAGQTNTVAAKFLLKYNYHNVTIFNRNAARAKTLAKTIEGAKGYALDTLPDWTGGFDCLIVCTAATQAIIQEPLYRKLLQGDTSPKVVIDLSIPHNVDAEVVANHAMHYIEIEGLKDMADANRSHRELAIEDARILLQEHLQLFEQLYRERHITRAMQQVPNEIKAIKEHAMNVVFSKKIADLDDDTRLLVEEMMSYMEKKCISIPMKAAKELATKV